MSHNIAVVAHRSRSDQAHQLMDDVGAAFMHMDNGTVGCDDAHRKAWTYLAAKDSAFSLVLEDDAVPVDGFKTQLEQALAVAPTPIVSLYLGRERPPQFQAQIQAATADADATDAHWITHPHLMHAVGVAIATPLVSCMLDRISNIRIPIDEAITYWARKRQHRVSYVWPSLIDHADLPTLVQHPDRVQRASGRVAWRTGTREQWRDTRVEM